MVLCMLSCLSHVWLFATPWTVAHHAPLSMGFSRQEYWSGLPCPPPGDLPDPGIKPTSFMSSALAGGFFIPSATWTAQAKWWGQCWIWPCSWSPNTTRLSWRSRHGPLEGGRHLLHYRNPRPALLCHEFFKKSLSCYLTLCDSMDCSTPGFPVLHYLPELAQTYVHWVGDDIRPSHPLLPSSPLALNLSQNQGLFQWVGSLHQVTRVLDCQGIPINSFFFNTTTNFYFLILFPIYFY